MAPDRSSSLFDLDINNDSINDFRFECEHVISLGGLKINTVSMRILDKSFEVADIEVKDTTFKCTDFSPIRRP